jgi:hypothetical protein
VSFASGFGPANGPPGAAGATGSNGLPGSPGSPGAVGASGARLTPFDRTGAIPSAIYVGTWPPGDATLPVGFVRHDRFLISIGVGIPKQWRAVAYQVVGAFVSGGLAQLAPQIIGSAANSQPPNFDPWTGLAVVAWSVDFETIEDEERARYRLTITTNKDPAEVTFACYGEQGTELVQL